MHNDHPYGSGAWAREEHQKRVNEKMAHDATARRLKDWSNEAIRASTIRALWVSTVVSIVIGIIGFLAGKLS